MPLVCYALMTLFAAVPSGGNALSLDGTWELSRTQSAEAPGPDAQWTPVQVPEILSQERNLPFLWYRRDLQVPPEFSLRHLFLCIGGARFTSEVYIDGQKVGGHFGGWEPFEIDVTSACRPGQKHRLLVRVQDCTGVIDQPIDYSKQGPGERLISQAKDSILAPIGSQFSRVGIWQPVSLVARGDLYIEHVAVRTSVRKHRIEASVTVRNLGRKPMDAQVAASVPAAVDLVPAKGTVPAGGTIILELGADWAQPKLWGPESPHLYQLSTSLSSGGTSVDQQSTRFGFREFWTAGTDMVLNGTPIKFLATAGHPRGNLAGDLSKAGALDYYARIREAGCVATRLHANVWPEWWYEAADETGMLLIMESALFCWAPNYALSRDEFWKNYHDHLRAIVRKHQNHPAIVMTSLENEILHCGGAKTPGTEHRLAEAGRFVKSLDPTRPILFDADGDPEGVADVVNLHYPLNFNKQNLWPEVGYWLETGMEVACWPHTFWSWDRKKPLYFGEFLHLQHFNEADPYSVLLGDKAYLGHDQAMARAKALAWEMQIEAYRACDVSGLCPWTLTETGPFPSDDNPRYLAVKRAYQKQAAFIRQYDWRFYAGEEVPRTVYLYNDTLRSARLAFSWNLCSGQKPLSGGIHLYELEPARKKSLEIRLQMPAVTETTPLVLTLQVLDGGKVVFKQSCDLAVFPRQKLELPSGLRVAVFGTAGDVLEKMLAASGCRLSKIDNLTRLPEAEVLLVAPHALDQQAPSTGPAIAGAAEGARASLDAFAARGGTVLVLEQDADPAGLLPATLVDRACTIAFRRSRDSTLLAGLQDEDFRFWRGDHVVARKTYRKPGHGPCRALVDSGGQGGLVYLPLAEIVRGKGRWLLCQLAVGEKLGQEPVAELLLASLLRSAAIRRPAPTMAGLVQEKLPLADCLTEIDARYADLSGKLATTSLERFPVMLLETDSAEVAAQQEKIREHVRGGGRVILHGGTPAGLARLAKLFPEPLSLQTSKTVPVNLSAPDAAIDGLTNQELYWYGSRKGMSYQLRTPLVTEVCHHVVVPGVPESARWSTLEAKSMQAIQGKPSVQKNVMYMGSTATIEGQIEVPRTGSYALALRSRGTALDGVFPQLALSIDGRRCGDVFSEGTEWSTAWIVTELTAGSHTVAISFVNDAWNPETRADRNVWIDKFMFTPVAAMQSTPLLAPAALVKVPLGKGFYLIDQVRWETDCAGSDNTGRYLSNLLLNLGADLGAPTGTVQIPGDQFTPEKTSKAINVRDGRAYLGTNGTVTHRLRFAQSRRYQFRIRASGTEVDEQYPNVALSIDGQRVGDGNLTRAGWQTVCLEAEVASGEHVVGLSFTNDLYRPPADRNLVISGLEVR